MVGLEHGRVSLEVSEGISLKDFADMIDPYKREAVRNYLALPVQAIGGAS
jgi:hypothetical protein